MLTQCTYFVALVLDNVDAHSALYRVNSLAVYRHLIPRSEIGIYKGFPRLLWFLIVPTHHAPNHWSGNVTIALRGSVCHPIFQKVATLCATEEEGSARARIARYHLL